ncbi:DUF3813 domain-containing protein [Thalassobacillus pellis]|uniref:DUF3813 domain-containing protein n=1 Tax=Thalassobacillus pellis TaxID=748008 RepID=UPI0019622889|nr:DUF3813 domain-containing protein [Thalassobacillus pellis]MBM7554064.1 hypothetical protein [Thalassobacillus pellis]
MENNLFQNAKNAVNRFTNARGANRQREKEAARQVIQSAYNNCSPEEQQQLQQLEQQLERHNQA